MSRVYRRADGRGWYVDFRDGRGRRVRKRVASERRRAERILRDLEGRAELERAGLAGPAEISAEDLWQRYRASLVARGVSDRTLALYTRWVTEVLAGVGVDQVEELRPEVVQAWRQERSLRWSVRTANDYVRAVRRMLAWGKRRLLIGENPLTWWEPGFEGEGRARRALEDAEAHRLLRGSPEPYRTMWLTFLTTGLRHRELVELRRSDVDFGRNLIRVRRGYTKTRREELVPVCSVLRDTLAEQCFDGVASTKRWGSEGGRHVFVNAAGRPWRNNLLRRFRMCCRRAGVDDVDLDIHSLRRTYGTMLAADPRNDVRTVMALMRHRSVRTTMELYARPRVMRMAAAVEKLPVARRGSGTARHGASEAEDGHLRAVGEVT